MPQMLGTIGLLSHLVAAIAFGALGVSLVAKRSPSGFALSVALAAFITAFWAGCHVFAVVYGTSSMLFLSEVETLRTAAWIGVLLLLQRRSLGLADKPSSSFAVAVALGFIVALQLALDILFPIGNSTVPLVDQPPVAMLFIASRLVLSISGLVLLHNLYVNSSDAGGLPFRLFAVGLGVIFAYDLNLYTLHFLTGQPSVALLGIRGAVNALAVPLIFFGMRQDVGSRFHLSRQVAFQTISFFMIGLYLIVMSMLAYGLRLTGGDWGQLLQVTFLAATLIGGALVMLSPRFRARLRVRIARNFYRYRYDYRVEWLRFIDMIDAGDRNGTDRTPFRERLIEAVATVLDCPGGTLLEPADSGGYQATARWRWAAFDPPRIAEGAAITLYFAETGRIVEFDSLRAEAAGNADGRSHATLMLPDWSAADRSIWLAIPLIHRDQLTAILILQRSIAVRDLNWEDFDLLRTLGRQCASYLAEAETQAMLDEAKSFDEYNRRFAFVMHDVKNVVSQLALVARNAERHADNPEFRVDMVATLNASVAKMTDLLKLMGREAGGIAGSPGTAGAAGAAPEEADVARILTMVAAALRRQHAAIELDGAESSILVYGDAQRLEAMITHIVQNAIDASAPEALIRLSLRKRGNDVRITIADSGHGMSAGFIREELFKPFRSTKDGGFGIGAFEAREIARAHGGRLDVESRPGEGSRFVIVLPMNANGARKPSVQVARS